MGVGVGVEPIRTSNEPISRRPFLYAKEIWAALVIKRRQGKTRIARVNGRVDIQQLMPRGVAAVILQKAEQQIGINLIAGAVYW